MNRLVSTLKYELLHYTSNMVHKKFNQDQLFKKLVVMNEFMDTIKSMKDNLEITSGKIGKMATTLNENFSKEVECKNVNRKAYLK
jgi:hypothetical protein